MCNACGKESPTIPYMDNDLCGECIYYCHLAERTIRTEDKVTHKSGNYYITKPVWDSKIPFYITACTGIAIIILMLIERTVN